MHPRSKHWHLIDYVITSTEDLKDVHVTEAMRDADCWTDHRLVRTRVSLSIQRPHRKCATKLPRRFDTALLTDPATQQRLSINVKAALELAPLEEGLEVDEIWGTTRNAVQKASLDTLGITRRRNLDWLDENDKHIQGLLENKQALHQMTLIPNASNESKSRYREACHEVQAETEG